MRKLIICLLAIAFGKAGIAQSNDSAGRKFKPFKVDISVGYAAPQNSAQGAKFNGGALFAIEPKYAVIDPLAIGVRVEGAVTAHVYNSSNNGSNNSNAKVNLSYILTLDYYFTNHGFRPFIGAGAGIYTTAAIDSNTSNASFNSVPRTSQFGYMARAGFEVGHLRIGVEYNFVANNASYLGLKIGVCFGGGRRRR
jgi:outer membrane protein W